MIPKGKHTRKRQEGNVKAHPEYQIWNGMLSRCLDPRNEHYQRYGAIGIKVCDRWMNFWDFVGDMGPRPTPSHSIDRIHNDKGYEPGNCRWATKREQTLNRSNTRFIEFRGITKCLTDWASELGMSVNGLRDRLMAGWDVERALTTPVMMRKRNKRSAT